MIKRGYLYFAIAITIVICSNFAGELNGDTLIRIRNTANAMKLGNMEMPARDDTTTIWLGKDKARMDAIANVSMIYDKAKDCGIMLYRKFDMYRVFASSKTATDSAGKPAAGLEAGLEALSPSMISNVTETNVEKMVNGYHCRKYLYDTEVKVTDVTMVQEVWASPDLKVDVDLYNALLTCGFANPEGAARVRAAMNKIKGFPILMVSASVNQSDSSLISGVKAKSELIEIKEVTATPGLYEIPVGFEEYKAQPATEE